MLHNVNIAYSEKLLVGAIRFDAWYTGSARNKLILDLNDENHIPFFLKNENSAEDETATIDYENKLAAEFGIDYWLFGYGEEHCGGAPVAESEMGNRSLRTFLNLSDTHGTKFAINVIYACFPLWDEFIVSTIEIIKNSKYITLSDGRPLIYFFAENANWPSHFGSPAEARDKFDRLRRAVKKSSGHDPYIVLLKGEQEEAKVLAESFGADAISLYANWVGEGQKEVPFKDYVARQKVTVKLFSEQSFPFIPLISTGWDSRPEIYHGYKYGIGMTRNRKTSWTTKPTSSDIHSAILEIIGEYKADVSCRDQVPTMLIYAWNELSEGGWLVPTVGEGEERLFGVRAAVRDLTKLYYDHKC